MIKKIDNKKNSKEKRYTKVKIDPNKKADNAKNVKSNNNITQKNKLPRKVNTKPKNIEQLTDSSIQEYTVSQNQNKEEYKIKNT